MKHPHCISALGIASCGRAAPVRIRSRLLSILWSIALLGVMTLPSHEVSAQTKTVVRGANIAYYFDDRENLLAIEAVNQVPRDIVVHPKADRVASWGLGMATHTACAALPSGSGKITMPQAATVVVYLSVGPTHMIVVGVEDPTSARDRLIQVLESDPHGACCCARIPCNGKLCCPPGCPASC
jgi:hypothetical protein